MEDISPLFYNSLYTAFIGGIITRVVQNKPTQVQLAFGILHRHSQIILTHLRKYGITCTYDKVLRFKKSAAANSSKGGYLNGVPKNNTLFQVISDNFDTEISSQNGKSQTKTPNLRENFSHTTFWQKRKKK